MAQYYIHYYLYILHLFPLLDIFQHRNEILHKRVTTGGNTYIISRHCHIQMRHVLKV